MLLLSQNETVNKQYIAFEYTDKQNWCEILQLFYRFSKDKDFFGSFFGPTYRPNKKIPGVAIIGQQAKPMRTLMELYYKNNIVPYLSYRDNNFTVAVFSDCEILMNSHTPCLFKIAPFI